MTKNLNGSFFTSKSLNGENELDINNLVCESAQIDDLSCSQLEIGDVNVIAKFGAIDNSINLLEQSIDDLSGNKDFIDISCANIDVSLNANIADLTCTGTKDFTSGILNLGSTILNSNIVGNSKNISGLNKLTSSTGNIIDFSCANLDVSLNANFADITATGTKNFTTGLLNLGSTIMNSNIVGNSHNITGLNNITSSEGTIDTLTTTNLNTTDVSCRSLYIENVTSNSRFITMEDDFNRDIASFTQKSISGINADGVDLSMVGYGGANTEILFSTDPDTNSYINVANFGIGTKTPSTKLQVSGGIKGTDLTITNDISCNNDLDVQGIGTFKDIVVTDTGTTGGSIVLTGELTINTPSFYGGTSVLKVNNVSYFNSNVGIGKDAASNPLHISTSGQDFIFNDKQIYLQNDPNITTGTQERRRIVADSTGENILFKLISNLGTGDTTTVDIFDGNMERTSANGFRPENQNFKGQRWVCRQPAIGENDATEQAYQLRAFGSASSQTGLFEYYYDGDAEFSGTLTQGSDKRLKENIVDANTTNLVSDFQKLRFVNFNMIADKTKLKKLGILAQDLQKIYPSAVKERKIRDDDDNEIDTRLSVKYEVLYLKSCMLVQHLLTENETLKSRLDVLESRLSALEII